MKGWLRTAWTVAIAMVVWLVASPARAAAPQCDTRGATTFAPAPTLDPPKESIDVGDPAGACLPSFSLEALDSGAPRGHEVHQGPHLDTLLPTPAALPAASATRTARDRQREAGERAGVRGTVDRPPRA